MALLAGLVLGTSAHPAAAADERSPAARDPQALEEIIVTARRREENIQDVPISITSYDGEHLRELDVFQAQDLTRLVPSLVVEGKTGRENSVYSLRGQTTSVGTGPAVSVYFAEVPIPNGRFGGGGGAGLYYDLRSVQVLKGPQGTLFGRNTIGGAVLLEPARPTDALEGYVNVTAGDFDRRQIQGAANFPLSDSLAMRVAGERHVRDGYTVDAVTGRDFDNIDYVSGRVSFLYTPNERLESYLLMQYLDSENHGSGYKLTDFDPNPVASFGGLTLSQLVALRFDGASLADILAEQEALGVRRTRLSNQEEEYTKHWGVTNITSFDLADSVQLRNIASYQRLKQFAAVDFDGSMLAILDQLPGGLHVYSDNITEELQLRGSSLGEQFDWIVGLYYEDSQPHDMDADPAVYPQQSFGGPVISIRVDREESSQAAYSQGTLDLSVFNESLSGLNLTVGYRYTEDERKLRGGTFIAGPMGNPVSCVSGAPPDCVLNFAEDFSATTYVYGLDYALTPDVLVYVQRRKGYKSGGFNVNLPADLAAFKDEVVKDLEVGLKSTFRVGEGVSGRFNLAAYESDAFNLQRNVPVVLNGQNTAVIVNVPKGRIRGVEMDASLLPLRSLEVGLAYSYMSGKYINGEVSIANNLVNLESEKWVMLPKHKVGLFATYELPLPSRLGELQLSGDYSYQSEYNHAVISRIDTVSSQQVSNARLSWTPAFNNSLTVSGFVSNMADEEYINGALGVSGTTNKLWGPPRMWGVEVGYRWQ